MNLPKNYLKFLLVFSLLILTGFLGAVPFISGVMVNTLQAAEIGKTVSLYKQKSLSLDITPLEYNQALDKWNYKINWDRQSKLGGSFFIKNIVYFADASGKGKTQTGFNLNPNTKYLITYYSNNKKRGVVVFSKYFTTLPSPYSAKDKNKVSISVSKTTIPETPPRIVSNCKVYTYQDKYYYGMGKRCLDKITIKGIYFVAKNQITGIKPYWQTSMKDIFTQTKNFYESQFNNKIQITIEDPSIIYGDKNIEDYNAVTLTQEVWEKITRPNDDAFFDLMIYPILNENSKSIQGNMGGGPVHDNGSSATNNYGWLDPESLGTVARQNETDYSGYIGSAHEFGHTISIPHPWDEVANKDSKGNIIDQSYENEEVGSLMSYGGTKGPLIPNSFIRSSIKAKMIVN